MKLRKLWVILTAALVLTLSVATANAAEVVASGECGADGDNVTWILTDDGVLTIEGEGEMKNYSANSYPAWHSYQRDITTAVIRDGITYVGNSAFEGCRYLISVDIPDSVTSLGEKVFAYCSRLTSINLPASLTTIPSGAFLWSGLTEVVLPDSIVSIQEFAFAGCDELNAIDLGSVSEIWNGAFYKCGFTSISIPNSVESLGDYAFAKCSNLTSVTFQGTPPEHEDLIGYSFGADPYNLKLSFEDFYFSKSVFGDVTATVYYPNWGTGWTEEKMASFGGDLTWVMTEIEIPYPFTGTCDKDGVVYWELNEDGVLVVGEKNVENWLAPSYFIQNCPWEDIRDLIIKAEFYVTGVSHMNDCPNLTEVWFGDAIFEIGGFKGCTSLTDIHISNNREGNRIYISSDAFAGCTSLTAIQFPDTLEFIWENAFAGCTSLTTVEFSSVSYIYEGAFAGCTSLVSVQFPEGTYKIKESAFEGCTSLMTIELPASINEIQNLAFGSCTSLSTIIFHGETPCGFDFEPFFDVTATCYYPAGAEGWTADIMQNYGGTLTWVEGIPEHIHNYAAKVTAPTCTEQGYTTYTCSCGDSYVEDYVDAAGHSWNEGEVTTQPTEENEGVRTYTCANCGETKTETIEKLDHVHSYETVVTAPTCTEQGYTTYTCSCGDSYVDDYVDATGIHEYDDEGVCVHCGKLSLDHRFVDIPADAWYYAAVDYVVERGFMNGTGGATFAPNAVVTRATVAQLLYNIVGKPDVSGLENPFDDVEQGAWYYAAVVWAADAGVVSGNGKGGFAPNDNVTREQLAIMIYNFANSMGYELKAIKDVDLSSFVDGDKTSSWAASQLKWACDLGLIGGKSVGGVTYLAPQDTATRAEIATIFMRFYQMVEG